MLRIGQLSQQTGVKTDTLRFYERKGLLPAPKRSENGYRVYDDAAISIVLFITRAKAVGFSLVEISELLSLRVDKAAHSCQEVKAVAESKLEKIDVQLLELQQMRQALQRISDACCGGAESATNCTILNALDNLPTDQGHR